METMMNDILSHRQAVKDNIMKSFGVDSPEELCKGVYVDNTQNRRLGRVGQQYGKPKSGSEKKKDKLTREEKSEIAKIFNKFTNRIYWGLGERDFETEKGEKFISDLKKYGDEKVAKLMVWKSKHSLSEGRSSKYQSVGRKLVGEKRFKELYYGDGK